MYSELWSAGRLRQGDIVGPVSIPFLGKKIGPDDGRHARRDDPHGDPECGGAGQAEVRGHCVARLRVQRGQARVHPVGAHPATRSSDESRADRAVRLSNDVKGRHEAKQQIDGVDSFLIDPIEGHLDGPQVISFTALMPYPTTETMLADLLNRKQAELTHDQRLLLKQKLAWFSFEAMMTFPPRRSVSAGGDTGGTGNLLELARARGRFRADTTRRVPADPSGRSSNRRSLQRSARVSGYSRRSAYLRCRAAPLSTRPSASTEHRPVLGSSRQRLPARMSSRGRSDRAGRLGAAGLATRADWLRRSWRSCPATALIASVSGSCQISSPMS